MFLFRSNDKPDLSSHVYGEQISVDSLTEGIGEAITMANESSAKTNVTLIESHLEKEAAAVLGKLAGASADGVVSTFSDIFGGLIGDRVKQWRTRNLVRSLAKTADFLKQQGIKLEDAKALPTGELYSVFENASKQDDQTISDMWSALIANAMHPVKRESASPLLVNALSSFDGADACVLQFAWSYEEGMRVLRNKQSAISAEYKHMMDDYTAYNKAFQDRIKPLKEQRDAELRNRYDSLTENFSEDQINEALSNLVSLRCIHMMKDIANERDLVEAERDEYGRSFLTLKAELLAKNFGELSRQVKGFVDGTYATRMRLVDRYGGGIGPNFVLTEFGTRLMRQCHID